MKRLCLITLLLVSLFLGGCGNKSALDTYSYGTQAITINNSEVLVPSPLELGKQPKPLEFAGVTPVASYAGGQPDMLVRADAYSPTLFPTAEALVNKQVAEIQKVAGSKAPNIQKTPIVLDGVPAIKVEYSVVINNQNITYLQYTFLHDGMLWNISYQYPTNSTIGKEIITFVVDKIKVTHKKEG